MAVVTAAEVKTHLNITATKHDTELTSFIARAEAVIGKHCGPLTQVAKTSRVHGGGTRLVLPVSPASLLVGITDPDGTAVDTTDMYLDEDAGVITYDSGGSFGARFYDVAYMAGRATCPDDLKMAVLELVRHFWDTQRGPTRRPGSTASDAASNTIPGAAYLLPFRVSQLIAPHLQPGFA